jgi:hypothetical protein
MIDSRTNQMKKINIILFICFIFFSCKTSTIVTDSLADCMREETSSTMSDLYSKKDFDIIDAFLLFEKELIKSELLKNKSRSSYNKFFELHT